MSAIWIDVLEDAPLLLAGTSAGDGTLTLSPDILLEDSEAFSMSLVVSPGSSSPLVGKTVTGIRATIELTWDEGDPTNGGSSIIQSLNSAPLSDQPVPSSTTIDETFSGVSITDSSEVLSISMTYFNDRAAFARILITQLELLVEVDCLNSEIQVGQLYSVESSDGLRTGELTITSIDPLSCQVCFDVEPEHVETFDWENEFDIKVFYPAGETSGTFCRLNPSM